MSEDLSSLPGSSHDICISVKLNLLRCPAADRLIFSAEKLIWREICSTTSVFIIRLNKYTAEPSFGSSRNFIAKDSLTSSKIYINAVYKNENFKRRDGRRSFSISLNFHQTILESSPQTRFMFDIKNLLKLIDYSGRNSTGRHVENCDRFARIPSKVTFTILLQVEVKP